ncbi:MAG: EMC3/TMCO1 family protein [Candidatus Bathyarchaeia archaeon]
MGVENLLPEFLRVIPYSTIFIMLLAFAISLVTMLLNRKFVDRRLISEWQKEIEKWNAEKELAKRTGDKKLMARVKKHEVQIMQMRAKISGQQTKTTLVTFVPLLVMWWALTYFYGLEPVAFIPLLWQKTPLSFFYWYLVCSLFFNFVLSRVFNVEMGLGARM